MLRHIIERRAALESIDVVQEFASWEESCVPSYVHRNPLAAFVAWWRLFRAVDLANRYAPGRRALDFGSSVGELAKLIPHAEYEFVESHDAAAAIASKHGTRRTLETLGTYDWIFALDSLEHNENYPELLVKLSDHLSSDGVLILSGPTENWLYRFGRKISGFSGHYHTTNIYAIEESARKVLQCVCVSKIIPGMSLFRLSVWARGV